MRADWLGCRPPNLNCTDSPSCIPNLPYAKTSEVQFYFVLKTPVTRARFQTR
jgi:hypothetical protein